MKDYKVKQLIYKKTVCADDDLSEIDHTVLDMGEEELVKYACQYFVEDSKVIFPAKSYAVAVIYAKLISKYFNEDFFDVLGDQDLFIGTDKFFRPYNEQKEVYNQIVDFLIQHDLVNFEESNISQVLKTVDYFKAEFLWD
ncbi:MAG: hypothetical protein VYA54_08960 [Bdellovibrionota bacterium]|nr:hypothetical protein [Bdellovibrionota bacterium]